MTAAIVSCKTDFGCRYAVAEARFMTAEKSFKTPQALTSSGFIATERDAGGLDSVALSNCIGTTKSG